MSVDPADAEHDAQSLLPSPTSPVDAAGRLQVAVGGGDLDSGEGGVRPRRAARRNQRQGSDDRQPGLRADRQRRHPGSLREVPRIATVAVLTSAARLVVRDPAPSPQPVEELPVRVPGGVGDPLG